MTSDMNTKIEELVKAIEEWLSPDNYRLKEAIDKTVNEGLSSFEDIKYQILTLKKTLKKGEFTRWVESLNVDRLNPEERLTVLCLHAGNLPLVGIQDILAVVLSSHSYLGKLSRKDPYLSETLLEILKKRDLLDGKWAVNLEELAGGKVKADALLFSGSTESVEPVIDALTSYDLADSATPKLVRTAHYSLALIDNDRPETFRQLANAVLRHGGSGCRSVAMVIAPFGLKSKKCEFTDYVEEFWLRNPQHKKPAPSLYYRHAYNSATGVEQSWLVDFMIEETDLQPTEPFILHWIEGDRETLNELPQKYRRGLQTIYVTDPDIELPAGLPAPEMLSDAQQPPIWWRPDGVDPLKWLRKLSCSQDC
jgi:hypothetical protein